LKLKKNRGDLDKRTIFQKKNRGFFIRKGLFPYDRAEGGPFTPFARKQEGKPLLRIMGQYGKALLDAKVFGIRVAF
jgi:hypothetical protein